jgi:4-hydroxybenzoate polyprenyltransferase
VTAGRPPGDILPDSVAHHPALAFAPAAWRPYVQLARLDRPIGWWLLLLPCWWSNTLATASLGQGPRWGQLALFLVGAVAMRGAGCTYNDLIDRDIDAKVARTRGRPLPSGRVTPRQALAFLVAQCGIGLAVLLCFDRPAILTGLASLAVVLVYPFMKRITSWPQAVLGLAFAWGGLIGWVAATGALAWPAILVYAAAICWTVGYDTIYALQDARDDPSAGVLSTARFFGANVRAGVALFYVLAVATAAAALIAAHAGPLAALGLAAFAAHLAWQVWALQPGDGAQALRLFRSNRNAGQLFFAGLLAQSLAAMASAG